MDIFKKPSWDKTSIGTSSRDPFHNHVRVVYGTQLQALPSADVKLVEMAVAGVHLEVQYCLGSVSMTLMDTCMASLSSNVSDLSRTALHRYGSEE